jgi:hypothetical protein
VHLPHPPPSLAVYLNEEDVIRIDMGPDPTAIGGVGDHQIIHSCVGNEAKTLQQLACRSGVQIHPMY